MNAQHTAAPAIDTAQLAAIVTQAAAVHSNARSLFKQLDEVRAFLAALNAAASDADKSPRDPLYWPALMQGLQRLMPSDSKLEHAIENMADALHTFNEDAAQRAAQAAPTPAAGAKRTRRARLACTGAGA